MPTKRSGKGTSTPPTYVEWKARTAALLERAAHRCQRGARARLAAVVHPRQVARGCSAPGRDAVLEHPAAARTAAQGMTEAISQPLTLRRVRDGRASAGHPDDYDVMSGHRVIGRIFRSNSAPQDRPWMWTITGAVVMPRAPSHGFSAKAKQPFAIAMRDGSPFGIAGIWENWKDPAGEWQRTSGRALEASAHDERHRKLVRDGAPPNRALQGIPVEQDCACQDLQARRRRREKLAPSRRRSVQDSRPSATSSVARSQHFPAFLPQCCKTIAQI
jgi:hypothetical protein